MAKCKGMKLTGKLNCTGCGLVKARERKVAKVNSRRATEQGELMRIGTTGPYPDTQRDKKYWMCAIDDYNDMCFVKKKMKW